MSEPRRPSYVPRASIGQRHSVKGSQLARIRVDSHGRMFIVVGGSLTLQVVSANKGSAHTIASEKELVRVIGNLKYLFAVPTVESINASWRSSLPADGPEKGGVAD